MSKTHDHHQPIVHQPISQPPIIQPMIEELKGKPKPPEDLGAPKPAPPEAVVDRDAEENPDTESPET